MTLTVSIQDTIGSGKVQKTIDVSFQTEVVTVKEIIEARVWKEVDDYNNSFPEYFNGLVQPTNAEKTLNGYRLKERKPIDAEKQVYIALDAFTKNVYFILVNNKQVESLDQPVRLSSTSAIRFVKLTPLVGG